MNTNSPILANFDEARQSQLPFVELLINMGYTYLSCGEMMQQRRGDSGKFLLKDIAFEQLSKINSYEADGKRCPFSESDVHEAIEELENLQYEGLIDTSQKIYNMIMPTAGGKTIKVLREGSSTSHNFRFIDFANPENNAFHVSVEYPAEGKQNIRPDIVCFVNGIPFAIIENKKSGEKVDLALSQFNRNWGPDYCPRLFTYAQLLVGTNGKDLRYGVTGSPNKFFAAWRETDASEKEMDERVQELIGKKIDADVYAHLLADLNGATKNHKQNIKRKTTAQDVGVVALLTPARLLDLTKNFILFDAGVKKISRYQQYFAIKKMLDRVDETEESPTGERRRGGLVWHTQGSGKSLMMVLFVKALIEDPHIVNPRVLIVTDRKDLNKQISDTFRNCGLKKKVTPARTSQHLLDLTKEKSLDVITTLVHKFERAGKRRAGFVDESKDIFVLIDEAHRTQGGMAHIEMKRVLPNACFIGFTGTPLMKNERSSNQFGGYIDKYTIDDALRDNVILPLVYEGRYVDLVQNKEQIDRQFERVADGKAPEQQKQLQKFATHRIIQDNPGRINEIAFDIEEHYTKNFQKSGLKGQIVAPSKFSAVLFQKYFEKSGKIQTAVVVSDENGLVGEEDSRHVEVKKYLDKVDAGYKNLESYEKSVIDSFKDNEDGVELLIVVDKLLTGFDAPRNTILYLTKDLKDHNLLQAIARVNRLFENGKGKLQKTTGFIIDYSENAKNLDTAMKLFGNFDPEDVQGTLVDVREKIDELEEQYASLHDLFKEVQNRKDDEAYFEVLADEQLRDQFYAHLNDFIKVFKECLVLQDFVHAFNHIDVYQRDLKKFAEIRRSASLRYADALDLSEYKQALIDILDKYVDARGVELLTQQISITDTNAFKDAIDELGSDKSKAEAIAAQTERTVKARLESDPEFYASFSKKIDDILREMREGKLADIEALKQLKLISEDVVGKKDSSLPDEISRHPGADIFYRNLAPSFARVGLDAKQLLEVSIELFSILKAESIVDWYKNPEVKRIMRNKLDDYLYDQVRGEMGIILTNEQIQSIVQETIRLAEHNAELF